MVNGIDPYNFIGSSIDAKATPAVKKHNRDMLADFKSMFSDTVKETHVLQKNSADMTQKMVAGDVEDIHQVMIAAEKAKIAFKFTLEIKNKIMSAFQEVNRMQI